MNARTVVLRRATPADAEAVADLWLASFRATYAFPPAYPDADVRRWLRGMLPRLAAPMIPAFATPEIGRALWALEEIRRRTKGVLKNIAPAAIDWEKSTVTASLEVGAVQDFSGVGAAEQLGGDGEAVTLRLDLHQRLTGFDELPFAEVHALDGARDTRRNRDALERIDHDVLVRRRVLGELSARLREHVVGPDRVPLVVDEPVGDHLLDQVRPQFEDASAALIFFQRRIWPHTALPAVGGADADARPRDDRRLEGRRLAQGGRPVRGRANGSAGAAAGVRAWGVGGGLKSRGSRPPT